MSRAELIKLILKVSSEGRSFVERHRIGLREEQRLARSPAPNDALYCLREKAAPGDSLHNKEMDLIVYDLN